MRKEVEIVFLNDSLEQEFFNLSDEDLLKKRLNYIMDRIKENPNFGRPIVGFNSSTTAPEIVCLESTRILIPRINTITKIIKSKIRITFLFDSMIKKGLKNI